jgi:hypothetical protein
MITLAPAQVDPLLVIPSQFSDVLSMLGGHNDLANGASAATVYSRISTYFTGRSARWLKVGFTIGASQYLIDHGEEAERLALNVLIRADHSYCNVFVDYAADPIFQNPANTTYYQADGIHYTVTGNLVLAQLVQTAITGRTTVAHPYLTGTQTTLSD